MVRGALAGMRYTASANRNGHRLHDCQRSGDEVPTSPACARQFFARPGVSLAAAAAIEGMVFDLSGGNAGVKPVIVRIEKSGKVDVSPKTSPQRGIGRHGRMLAP